MKAQLDLILCSIIESDSNGDTIWVWNYPMVEESLKKFVLHKYKFQTEHNNIQPFVFSKFEKVWFYIYNSDSINSEKMKMVKHFAIVLVAKDYSPQKYETFCRLLSKTYTISCTPVEVLKLYLSAFTNGVCSTVDGDTFSSNEFETVSFGSSTNLKGLIKIFELETILIYTALLLKKRVVVYHHSLEQLLKWISTFPALMKHRKIVDSLFSWIDLVPEEISQLKKHSFYVAGCPDSLISSKSELYDLLVNIPAREIIVPNHAKESFTMTKTHKEIALFIVQLGENQSIAEAQVISEIADKTQDLLNQLTTLATKNSDGTKKVPIQAIKEKNLAASVENFLIQLAIAEDLLVR
ncbi:hypothetical protein QAD02_010543 [Eretmocerus hayati]|uniref:Uncharacterized protein n=1 Tax=Eretmocerus hayati TaxID=131215 RepID=A0ACC2NX13_9HYME|nr:hypothetical protein QAD02_010543 [Eretmocerus hayati]